MLTVAFQGARGAYGEQAVFEYAGEQAEPVPCRTLADVFAAVALGSVSAGMIPVENSQAGSINESYDLLRKHDLFIQDEFLLRVDHCLLVLPGQNLADLRRIYSHPQALAQCDQYIHGLGVEAVATWDTAGSAQMLRDRGAPGEAAIASSLAAAIYDLEILAHRVQTIKDNYTRFLVLGREPAPRQDGPQRTALVMTTDHRPGALYHCLGVLAHRSINLLKLESRPSRNRPWEYVFYLDFEGHREDPEVREALAELADLSVFVRVLGSFPRRIS